MENQKAEVKHLYVHFPFCRSKCAYCGFYSVVPNDRQNEMYRGYLDSLSAELAAYTSEYDLSHLETIFIGGGSPSFITSFVSDFNTILSKTANSQKSSADDFCEFTIECNPTQITDEFIAAALSAGVNRFSMGVQSFCQSALDRFGRHQTPADVITALERLNSFRSSGAEFTVSIDLINHLLLSESDLQTEVSSLRNILLRYDFIKHISIYDLTFDEGSRIYTDRSIRTEFDSQQNEDTAAAYSELMAQLFTEFGFHRYEVSNWCRDGYQCRHNLGYWLYHNYIGLGPAAHSTIDGLRIENGRNIDKYIADWRSIRNVTQLTKKEQVEEYLLMNLRLLNNPINHDTAKLIPNSIKHYQKIGWLTSDCAAAESGIDYLNTMLVDMFDELR